MRPMSQAEKTQSEEARKRANRLITASRKKLSAELRSLPLHISRRDALLRKIEALRNVSGLPAVVQQNGYELTLDYQMFLRFIRTLRHRRYDIYVSETALRIVHYSGSASGSIELYNLPNYQREVLTDLPIISLDDC